MSEPSIYADLIAIANGDLSVARRRLQEFTDYANNIAPPPSDSAAALREASEREADEALHEGEERDRHR